MIGIVGRSGSGKTTLANLIGRFYDVDAGRVTIDGRDIRTLAREDLRCQVGTVLQEPFLFRGTVWENLLIDSIQMAFGLLSFRVVTDRGPAEFTMRSGHSYTMDYGCTGKMLLDVNENRSVIEDIEALPRRQQVLFRRYIYW